MSGKRAKKPAPFAWPQVSSVPWVAQVHSYASAIQGLCIEANDTWALSNRADLVEFARKIIATIEAAPAGNVARLRPRERS